MAVMLYVSVFFLRVTLETGTVAGEPQFRAVGIVAIAAGNAGGEHLALLERAVIVGLLGVQHLSVGLIETPGDRQNHVGIGQRLSGSPAFRKFTAPGVTEAAGFHLGTQRARRAAASDIAGFGIGYPNRIAPLGKSLGQSHGRVVDLSKPPPTALIARPTNMA